MTITINPSFYDIPINEMQSLPMGAGGATFGIQFADDGTGIIRTDVFNFYKLPYGGSHWLGMNGLESWGLPPMGVTDTRPQGGDQFFGVWDASICATDSDCIYQISGCIDLADLYKWAVHVTFDGGASWTQTSMKMGEAGTFSIRNNRGSLDKMKVDPNQPLHCIVGTPWGSGDSPAGTEGLYRTVNGGSTWTQKVSTASHLNPGWGGVQFDRSSALLDIGGGTMVTSRAMACCGGVGYFETWDGGATWVQASTDPTPSSANITVTTTDSDSVIFLNIMSQNFGTVAAINNVSGSPTWNKRLGGQFTSGNPYGNGNQQIYWALAPAGTYVFNVSYLSGNLEMGPGDAANIVSVFALKNVDVTSAGANVFATASPQTMNDGFTYSINVTHTGMIVVFGRGGGTSVDTGFSLLNQSTTYAFWSEMTTTPVSAGTYTDVGGASGLGYSYASCIDAIRQGTGTIQLDGTPQLITSGPSTGDEPAGAMAASFSTSGKLFVINGPMQKARGTIHRYTIGASAGNGTWERIDTDLAGMLSTSITGKGEPGGSVCCHLTDADKVYLMVGGGNNWMAWRCDNADEADITDTVWFGTAPASGIYAIIRPSDPGWLTEHSGYGSGGFAINPQDDTLWFAHGIGAGYYNHEPNWAYGSYDVDITMFGPGIEESLSQTILTPPGSDIVIIGVEDRNQQITSALNYTTGVSVPHLAFSYDTHTVSMDYATDNPDFVCAFAMSGINGSYPSYSFSAGAEDTWSLWSQLPMGGGPGFNGYNNLVAQIACSSAVLEADYATWTGVATRPTASSVTSMTATTGSKSFTIEAGKGTHYCPGFPIVIQGTAASNDFMRGTITSYDNATGAIVCNITTAQTLAGTVSAWTAVISSTYPTPFLSQSVLVMSSVTGTPALGNIVSGSGVTPLNTLAAQGGGSYTNSWILAIADVISSPTSMSATLLTAEICAITCHGGAFYSARYSTDAGSSWADCTGLPAWGGYHYGGLETFPHCLAADHAELHAMYCFAPYGAPSPGAGTYKSEDGGANWTKQGSFAPVVPGVQHYMYCTPGIAGDLWLHVANGSTGLYHSTDEGANWSLITGTSACYQFDIGATRPGTDYPCIIMQGISTDVPTLGWKYSTDEGATWTAFDGTVPDAKSFAAVRGTNGDLNIPGRFYFHTYPCGANWIQLF